jgi:hypothetical protein
MPTDAGAGGEPPGRGSARWRIPFWALQVLEFGVAFLLVTQSVHVGRGDLLVAGGIVFGLLALTADGPLGVVKVCSQRVHVPLVAGAALLLGALAFVPSFRPDVEGLLVIAGAVVAVVLLATRTITASNGRGRRSRSAAGQGPVIDVTATVVPPPDGPAAGADGKVTDDDDPDSALRRAGRTTGAAAAAGKRVVDGHRPQVEEQLKRTLRGAGRFAGKLAGPKAPPADPPA